MGEEKLQHQIIDQILRKFRGKGEAVEYLSELLKVSRNSVYRRLREETFFTPDELMILCREFEISLDVIIHPDSNLIPFSFNLFAEKHFDFLTFMQQVKQNLQAVVNTPNVYVYYASQEIPPFQYMFFPELLAFKLYVYGLTSWDFHFLKDRKFRMDLVTPAVTDLGLECVRLYSLIPSKDLWSIGIIDNTLHQIEYIAADNRFEDPTAALRMCDQVKALLERARTMAEYGRKFFKAPDPATDYAVFDLYYNEMISTNNTILVKTRQGTIMYTTYTNPNFLKTSNQRFCRHSENWFDRMVSRSISISVHSTKERNRFFNRMLQKVDATRRRIELMQTDGILE